MKNQENLIQRPRNTKPEVAPAVSGVAPEARAGPQVPRGVVPGTAANHPAAAVPFPAIRRPLPQVADHVRQARSVRTGRADRARSIRPRPSPQHVASRFRPGSRPAPFLLGRQPVLRPRPTAQPRHILLCIFPAYAGHRMPVRLSEAGVPPRITVTQRVSTRHPRRRGAPGRAVHRRVPVVRGAGRGLRRLRGVRARVRGCSRGSTAWRGVWARVGWARSTWRATCAWTATWR